MLRLFFLIAISITVVLVVRLQEEYCAKPRRVRKFLSDDECNDIISLAENTSCLKRSKVEDQESVSNARTSSTCFLKDDAHPTIKAIKARVEKMVGIPQKYYEDLQVIRYRPRQQYLEHYDVRLGTPPKDIRQKTVLLYLNDDFEGGETEFKNAGITISPEKGMALVWDNVNNQGTILPGALHAGLPVDRGSKYACTIWIRGFAR